MIDSSQMKIANPISLVTSHKDALSK